MSLRWQVKAPLSGLSMEHHCELCGACISAPAVVSSSSNTAYHVKHGLLLRVRLSLPERGIVLRSLTSPGYEWFIFSAAVTWMETSCQCCMRFHCTTLTGCRGTFWQVTRTDTHLPCCLAGPGCCAVVGSCTCSRGPGTARQAPSICTLHLRRQQQQQHR